MNSAKALKTLDYELLLLFYAAGALIGVLHRGETAELLSFVPGSSFGCVVLILLLDGALAGALLAWYTYPLITLAFGAVSAAEADMIMRLGLHAARSRLFILITAAPLHFLLSGWSLYTATRLRGILRSRGKEMRVYIVSLLLMAFAYLACAGVVYLQLKI